MSSTKIIQQIEQGGGWCKIKTKQPLSESIFGCIVFRGANFLIIARFNEKGDFWDGFLILPETKFRHLERFYWLKKFLSVLGKATDKPEAPSFLTTELMTGVLDAIHKAYVAADFHVDGRKLTGLIDSFDQNVLIIKQIDLERFNERQAIIFEKIDYISIGSSDIRNKHKSYRRVI